MSQDKNAKAMRVGVVTTVEAKERMRITLAGFMRTDTIHLAHPFLGRRVEARDEVVTQLRGYAFVIKESKSADPTRPPKVFLSGKGAGKNDDLAIVCQMCRVSGDDRAMVEGRHLDMILHRLHPALVAETEKVVVKLGFNNVRDGKQETGHIQLQKLVGVDMCQLTCGSDSRCRTEKLISTNSNVRGMALAVKSELDLLCKSCGDLVFIDDTRVAF